MKERRLSKLNKQKGFIINPFLSEATIPDVDPYWNLSQLQLNGDEGSIVDRSPMNCTVTPSAGVTVSNTRSKYGTTSIHVPSVDNILSSKNGCFSYQYGDFELHIDIWFENDVAGNTGFIKIRSDEGYGRLWFMRTATGAILFDMYGYGGSATSTVLPSGQWHSLVLGRIDQWIYVGINGTLYQMPYITDTSGYIGNTTNGTINIYGAAGGSGGIYFNNFRVLACRNYLFNNLTTSYTPPTSFYPKQGVDTSIYDPMWKNVLFRLPINPTIGVNDVSNNRRYTVINGPGSIVQDASGYDTYGYLNSNADGHILTYANIPTWSNWTLEAKIRWTGGFTNGTNDKRIMVLLNGSTPVNYIQCAVNASGSVYSHTPAIGGYYHFSFTPIPGIDYRVLFQRNGRFITLYVDGVYKGQAMLGGAGLDNVNNIIIGGVQSTGQSCFIDDIRMTLGTRATCVTAYDNTLPIAHTQQFPTQGYVKPIALPDIPEYAADVLLDNPLFYYRLNESSGTIVVDSSGNARHGSYVGSPKLQTNGLLTNESSNKAVRIGATDYINIPYAAWMNVGNNIALEAIIKTSTSLADTIISRRYAAVGSHVFHFRMVNGYLTLIVFNSGGGYYTWYNFNYPINADSIYHAVVTFNGSLIKFYVNGRLMDQSYCVLSFPSAPTTAIDIGRDTTVASPYETYYGVIDEVAMYAQALPYARITSHANKAKLLLTDNTISNALTGAVCILALRVLKPGYSSNLIKVRRSSDNTELIIGSLNGELDTISLLNFVGSGSGYVSIWYDQSGTGNNFTQATLASQPLIVVNGVLLTYNNKPCIKAINNAFFDAGNILNDNYHFTMNYLTDSLLMSKGRDGNGNGWSLNWGVSSNTASIVLVSGGAVGYTLIGATQTPQFKTKRIQYVHGATSYYKIYNDGDVNGEITQAKYGLRTSTIGIRLGRYQDTYFSGRASELIIHNSLLPDYLSDVIRENQASYYSSVNADPYFSSVSLLLNCEGTHGSTTVLDKSINTKLLTPSGGVMISTDQKVFGNSSLYFNGVNAYLSTDDSVDFYFGTGEWAIEFYMKAGSVTGTYSGPLSVKRPTVVNGVFSIMNQHAGTGKLHLDYYHNGWLGLATNININDDQWHLIKYCRIGNVLYVYVDNVLDNSVAVAAAAIFGVSGRGFHIGYEQTDNGYYTGYLDEIRITNSFSRSETSLIAPTGPYPIY